MSVELHAAHSENVLPKRNKVWKGQFIQFVQQLTTRPPSSAVPITAQHNVCLGLVRSATDAHVQLILHCPVSGAVMKQYKSVDALAIISIKIQIKNSQFHDVAAVKLVT